MFSRGHFQPQWLCDSKMSIANDLVGIADTMSPAPKFSKHTGKRTYRRKQITESLIPYSLTSCIVRLTLKVRDVSFSDLSDTCKSVYTSTHLLKVCATFNIQTQILHPSSCLCHIFCQVLVPHYGHCKVCERTLILRAKNLAGEDYFSTRERIFLRVHKRTVALQGLHTQRCCTIIVGWRCYRDNSTSSRESYLKLYHKLSQCPKSTRPLYMEANGPNCPASHYLKLSQGETISSFWGFAGHNWAPQACFGCGLAMASCPWPLTALTRPMSFIIYCFGRKGFCKHRTFSLHSISEAP